MLRLALVPSNNIAIRALARTHSGVVDAVNTSAADRGLQTIHIDEPSGLSPTNRASAIDIARFIRMIKDSEFTKVSIQENVSVEGRQFKSTNPLLGKPGWNFYLSKTGFINASGGCLATLVEIGGRPLVVVILGSMNTVTRWVDLIKIRAKIAQDQFWTFTQEKINERRNHPKRRSKNQ